MVKVTDSGMQIEEFLRSFLPLESLLLSFPTPCRPVGLFNDVVAPGRGDHLLVVDVNQRRNLPDRRSVTLQLIGMNDLWDIVFTQEASQERLRGLGVAMPLEKDALQEAVLVHGPPQPVSNAIDARADLILSANSSRAAKYGKTRCTGRFALLPIEPIHHAQNVDCGGGSYMLQTSFRQTDVARLS